MEDLSHSTPDHSRSISGASSVLDPLTVENAQLSQGEDLPMIVWLRGDELFLDDFCLDADAAMKALGIKRSRLTQISGKELRVGRLRIDRYTRPVYRTQDIENYKTWTRSTVSHLRASAVIEEAAAKLETQSIQVGEHLAQQVQSYIGDAVTQMGALQDELRKHQQNYVSQSSAMLEHQKLEFFAHLDRSYEEVRMKCDAIDHRLNQLTTMFGDYSHLERLLVPLQTQLVDLAQSQVDQQRESQAKQQEIMLQIAGAQAFDRDLGKAVSLLLQFQRDTNKKQDDFREQLVQVLAQTAVKPIEEKVEPVREEPVVQQRRPIKKVPYALRRRQARRMF